MTKRCCSTVERTLWRKDIRLRKRRANVFQTQAHRGERDRIHLHAHGRFRAAADDHLTDAFDLADALADDLIGQIVNLRQRQRVRSHRQHHDRRVGWIDFAIGRRLREPARQFARRCVDGALHVARRAVDVAIQIELDRDGRTA